MKEIKYRFLLTFYSAFIFFLIMIPQILISKHIFNLKFNEYLMWGVLFISCDFTARFILPKKKKKDI
jgi:hypothetical protein